jgi:hypothetical protein
MRIAKAPGEWCVEYFDDMWELRHDIGWSCGREGARDCYISIKPCRLRIRHSCSGGASLLTGGQGLPPRDEKPFSNVLRRESGSAALSSTLFARAVVAELLASSFGWHDAQSRLRAFRPGLSPASRTREIPGAAE